MAAASTQSLSALRCAFIGGGNLTKAVAGGLISSGFLDAEKVCISTPHPENLKPWLRVHPGVATMSDNIQAAKSCDVIFLVVKPHILPSALEGFTDMIDEPDKKLFVSLAAGVRIDALSKLVGESARIIRVMPNTPAAVQQCAAAISSGPTSTADDVAFVQSAFESIGSAVVVPESSMDGESPPAAPPPRIPNHSLVQL